MVVTFPLSVLGVADGDVRNRGNTIDPCRGMLEAEK